MAKDVASQAPKEMVNIRLPAPEPGAEGEELPLRLAVVGDFTGKDDETPLSERKMQNVSSTNFNDVMASMEVSTSFSVPNKISGGEDEELPVDLKFGNLKSFRPEQIAKQVPQVKELVDFRKKLIALRSEAVRDPAKLREFNEVLARLGLDKTEGEQEG
jgi:type VI secretion system protein ImpB